MALHIIVDNIYINILMTSSIFSNRIEINKPSDQTPASTCPLAIYSSSNALPVFVSSVDTNVTNAKTYMSNATVTTDANNMLIMFGGASGGNLMWYMRNGTSYVKYQQYGSGYFTGQHKTQPDNVDIKTNIDDYVGKIMSSNDTGYTSHDEKGNKIIGSEAIYITEALPNCSLSCVDNDPCVFGILTNAPNGVLPDNIALFEKDSDNIFENFLYGSVRVNSLGEGAMWVSNINGPIKNGDWITSSRIPGIGKRQSDEFMHNYTVAKATMSCDFDLNSEKYDSKIILFESNEYIMAYIGVTYHCG